MSLRPNFFVGIRLSCPVFANAIVAIQNDVIASAPSLQHCRMDPRKLHLTSFVLCLRNAQEIQLASECLQSCQADVSSILRTVNSKALTFQQLGHFPRRVLYAEPVHDDVLAALRSVHQVMESRFIDAGLLSSAVGTNVDTATDASHWTPHATVLKISYDRKNGRKLNIKTEYSVGCERHLLANYTTAVTAAAPTTATGGTGSALSTSAVFAVTATDRAMPAGAEEQGPTSTTCTAVQCSGSQSAASGGIQVPLTTIDLLSMQELQADGYYRSYVHIDL